MIPDQLYNSIEDLHNSHILLSVTRQKMKSPFTGYNKDHDNNTICEL